MKLQLLHGPAISNSRAKLIQLKKAFDPQEVVVFDGEYDLGQIKAQIMTPSLFSANENRGLLSAHEALENQRLIILENPPEDFIFDFSLTPYPLSLVIWFDHEVSEKKPIMEWVKKEKGEIYFFPEGKEVSVFPFLDLLAEGNVGAFLELEKLKKSGFDIQYFITMAFYLLRSLATTPKNAPQFVKQKLERQRRRFGIDKIKNLYKEVLEIDFKIKSGLLDSSQAEFVLINKFLQ